MAVQFDGGVVIGADSRTTTGSYIVSRLLSLSAPSNQVHTFASWALTRGLPNRLIASPTNSLTSTTASTAVDPAQPQIPKQ